MEMLLDQMYNYALDEKESPHRFRWSWNILFFSFLVLILSSSLIWELKLRVQSLIRNFSFHWTIKFLHKIEEKFLRKDTGKQFNKINK